MFLKNIEKRIEYIENEVFYQNPGIFGGPSVSLKDKMQKEIDTLKRKLDNRDKEIEKIKAILAEVVDYVYED